MNKILVAQPGSIKSPEQVQAHQKLIGTARYVYILLDNVLTLVQTLPSLGTFLH